MIDCQRCLCIICRKKIRCFQYFLKCSYCERMCHYQCIAYTRDECIQAKVNNWICTLCLSDELPFNHYDNEFDFLTSISELWYDYARPSLEDLDKLIFIPFDLNDDQTQLPISDIDPDVNFYNHVNCESQLRCNYYLEDKFIDICKTKNLYSSLSMFHVNIRSLVPKVTKLDLYIKTLQCEFKVIGITETWLLENKLDSVHLQSYNACHNFRNTIGGGTSIYIHQSITFTEKHDFSLMEPDIECIFVELEGTCLSTNKNVLIGVIYRPTCAVV